MIMAPTENLSLRVAGSISPHRSDVGSRLECLTIHRNSFAS